MSKDIMRKIWMVVPAHKVNASCRRHPCSRLQLSLIINVVMRTEDWRRKAADELKYIRMNSYRIWSASWWVASKSVHSWRATNGKWANLVVFITVIFSFQGLWRIYSEGTIALLFKGVTGNIVVVILKKNCIYIECAWTWIHLRKSSRRQSMN